MLIRDILKMKGERVETLWPRRPLAEAMTRFEDRNISSVVVTDHAGTPVGIVTDRDVLRALVKGGSAALQWPLVDAMQAPPPTCTPSDSVTNIMHRMTFDRIRHVVVMNGGKLAGIVSIGDVVKSRLRDADLESRVLRERALSKIAAE